MYELEENELLNQMLLRGSVVGLEPQASSSNINRLIESMMGCAVARE